MKDRSFLQRCQPPWMVFPHLKPDELSRHLKQGVAEPWFDQKWRPFWSALTAFEKNQYLDFWHASEAWKEALKFFFDGDDDIDGEADRRESEEYLGTRRNELRQRPSLLARLFRRRRR